MIITWDGQNYHLGRTKVACEDALREEISAWSIPGVPPSMSLAGGAGDSRNLDS